MIEVCFGTDHRHTFANIAAWVGMIKTIMRIVYVRRHPNVMAAAFG